MKNFSFSNVKNFRYERKFFMEKVSREEVETLIKLHPAIFFEIYHKRKVNSLYFDGFNFQNYFDNVNGVTRRIKVRVRWYGDTFGVVAKPTLELKLKHNLHCGKLQYSLKPFTLDEKFSINTIRKVFKESSLPETLVLHLLELEMSLMNNYNRKYFLSSDRNYRITTDTDMQTYKVSPWMNNFLCEVKDVKNVILELKYNKPHDEFVENITNFFPFRMTRSSKYVEGIARLNI